MDKIINYIESAIKDWQEVGVKYGWDFSPEEIEMETGVYALIRDVAMESDIPSFVDNMDKVADTLIGNSWCAAYIHAEEDIIYQFKELWLYAGWVE